LRFVSLPYPDQNHRPMSRSPKALAPPFASFSIRELRFSLLLFFPFFPVLFPLLTLAFPFSHFYRTTYFPPFLTCPFSSSTSPSPCEVSSPFLIVLPRGLPPHIPPSSLHSNKRFFRVRSRSPYFPFFFSSTHPFGIAAPSIREPLPLVFLQVLV